MFSKFVEKSATTRYADTIATIFCLCVVHNRDARGLRQLHLSVFSECFAQNDLKVKRTVTREFDLLISYQ